MSNNKRMKYSLDKNMSAAGFPVTVDKFETNMRCYRFNTIPTGFRSIPITTRTGHMTGVLKNLIFMNIC